MPRYTLEQLRNAEATYAEAVAHVRIGDRDVTYRSLTEMRELIREMREDLGVHDSTKPGPLVFTSCGYDGGLR